MKLWCIEWIKRHNFLVILITGGTGKDNSVRRSVEMLYPNDTKRCDMIDLPYDRYWHTLNNLLMCYGTSCMTFTNGVWTYSATFSARLNKPSFWNFIDSAGFPNKMSPLFNWFHQNGGIFWGHPVECYWNGFIGPEQSTQAGLQNKEWYWLEEVPLIH